MSLLARAPDRSDVTELRVALEAVRARLQELATAAPPDEERLSHLVVAVAAGDLAAQVELNRLKERIGDRNNEIDDLERASRRLSEDLTAAQECAVNALRLAWHAIERKLVKRRKCAVALERALHEAAELWRRYDRLGQQIFAAVPEASRSEGYTYLQPSTRGTILGDYVLAKALASTGLGIASGTHLPSENDLDDWQGLPFETDEYGRRLIELKDLLHLQRKPAIPPGTEGDATQSA